MACVTELTTRELRGLVYPPDKSPAETNPIPRHRVPIVKKMDSQALDAALE